MPRPRPIPLLDGATAAAVHGRGGDAPDPATRRRSQMGRLVHLGQCLPGIARSVLRRRDTGARVRHRFRDGGLGGGGGSSQFGAKLFGEFVGVTLRLP
jgi:hypothetical protein